MSANKYASLPDIDTAPDVYETEDVFPSAQNNDDSSDDELGQYTRSHARGRNGDGHPRPEEIDWSSLNKDEASKKFRRIEKRRPRARIQYTYPPSPSSSASGRDSPAQHWPSLQKTPVAQRLHILQSEVAALEQELASQGDEKEQPAGQPNTAELMRELADVKVRLSKVRSAGPKDTGRSKLVNAMLTDKAGQPEIRTENSDGSTEKNSDKATDMSTLTAEIDRRLGALERAIGSSTTALDETSPLLPPLLVTVTRLHSMLSLLSQPRHLDNISRRLKLIQPDLERTSNVHTPGHAPQSSLSGSQRRQTTSNPLHSSVSSTSGAPLSTGQSTSVNKTHLEQLTPILTRLTPILPNIPHILTRLRSLSALHTNAASFQATLEQLEAQQAKERTDLVDLEKALEGIEKSIRDNEGVVKRNVENIEARVDGVVRRIEDLQVTQTS